MSNSGLRPANLVDITQAMSNALYVNPVTLGKLFNYPSPHYITITSKDKKSKFYFSLLAYESFGVEDIGVGKFARLFMKISVSEKLSPIPFQFE